MMCFLRDIIFVFDIKMLLCSLCMKDDHFTNGVLSTSEVANMLMIILFSQWEALIP